MNKVIFLVLFGMVLWVTGCEKSKFIDNSLIGKWRWEMTKYLGGAIYSTSESVDSTFYIEFRPEGYYYLSNNSNHLISLQKFEMITENTFRLLDGTSFRYSYSVKNDTLIVSNIDGLLIWINYYSKFK
jgi:hypothetical protein